VRDGVRLAEGVDDEVRADQEPEGDQHTARVAPNEPAAFPRPPEGHRPDAHEQRASGDQEDPGVVVPGETVLPHVVAGLRGAHDDHEDADPERERRPRAGPETRVGPGAKHEERGLDQTADEVITGRRTRLRLQEVVVDDVHSAHRERDPGKTRLGEGGCRDACRGSLSRFR
jgi:hypothetical protein